MFRCTTTNGFPSTQTCIITCGHKSKLTYLMQTKSRSVNIDSNVTSQFIFYVPALDKINIKTQQWSNYNALKGTKMQAFMFSLQDIKTSITSIDHRSSCDGKKNTNLIKIWILPDIIPISFNRIWLRPDFHELHFSSPRKKRLEKLKINYFQNRRKTKKSLKNHNVHFIQISLTITKTIPLKMEIKMFQELRVGTRLFLLCN